MADQRTGIAWDATLIREMLLFDDHWLERGILAIYKQQTTTEQQVNETIELNGVGFNGCDAEFMSSLAKWLLSGRHLSARQRDVARKRMVKYSGQLEKIAKGVIA